MKKVLLSVFMLLLMCTLVSPVVYATSYKPDFDYEPVAEEEQKEIWEQIALIEISVDTDSFEQAQPIVCFDVSSEGNILLAVKNGIILVYDDENKLSCGFKFNGSGSYYAKWRNNHILLFDVRSNMVIEFTTEGDFVQVQEAPQNSVNNNHHWNQFSDKFQQKTEINANNKTYKIINDNIFFDLLSMEFSKCVVVDGESTTILYDVSSVRSVRMIVFTLLIVGFVLAVLFIIINKIKQNNEEKQSNVSESNDILKC